MRLRGDGPLLVMWSGGIDSTLVVYEALRQGRTVRAHHIHLASSQGRAAAEERAIAQLVRWLDAQGLPGTLELTRSTTDFGDLRRVLDVKVWSWWIGVILAYEREIGQVATTQHRQSFPNAGYRRRSMQIREQMPALSGRQGRQVEWLSPLAGMDKAEIVAAMPDGLLELCWWCRTPDAAGRPCHDCHTCRQVDPALEVRPVDPDPEPDAGDDDETAEPEHVEHSGVEHVGAGWYEVVVNGETVDKVRGKPAAEARFAELVG
jgi:7-cyano-7-deazaguanine synthase in queuosine biosynthesis